MTSSDTYCVVQIGYALTGGISHITGGIFSYLTDAETYFDSLVSARNTSTDKYDRDNPIVIIIQQNPGKVYTPLCKYFVKDESDYDNKYSSIVKEEYLGYWSYPVKEEFKKFGFVYPK